MERLAKIFSAHDMTDGKPWKNLLIFTIPMLIGNLFQQLYSTVDAVIVGRYLGDDALAAVGVTIPIFFLMLVLLTGISVGAGIMVAQYFGAQQRVELSHTIGTCITVIVLVGLVIMIFAPMGTLPVIHLMRTPEHIEGMAAAYINIQLWGILGMGLFNILAGVLRGLGDSFSALLFLAIASVMNIVLDILFVAGFGWGVEGVALATVTVQFMCSLLCLWRLKRMKSIFDMGFKYLKPKKSYVVQVLKLGVPSGASQAVFAIAMMVVQPLANSFGALFIACNVIVMRIDGFVMMPNFSFGNAITVYTGQNVGAGKLDRVTQGTGQCLKMAAGTAVIMVSLILVLSGTIAGLFTETAEVIDMSVRMLRILAPGYVVFSFSAVLWGVIRGAGDAITPMWTSLLITVAIRVPLTYLLVHWIGKPEALFYGLLLAWTANTVFAVVAYRIGKWRTKGIVRTSEG